MSEKRLECIKCKQIFIVQYCVKDQSSLSACKRKYCSIECKKANKKNILTKKSILLKCEYCLIDYYKPPSQAGNSRFCSRLCANRKYSQNSKKIRHAENCLFCNASLDVIETNKRRIIKRKYCDAKCFSLSQRTTRKQVCCEICKKIFECLETKLKRFCSRNCQYSAQSAGLVKLPTNGRAGYRTDLPKNMRFKSSFEADYARYCNFIGKKFEYEPSTFEITLNNGKIKRYTPDFYLPEFNLYVETKAKRKDRKFEGNLESLSILKKEGLNIEVVYMLDFYEILKINGYYEIIDNLEHRDYKGTKHLVIQNY